ncbi:phage late control D family protein, partial [Escherichia coli]|nr:phage late control D family protein [Escherichia coli]
RLMSLSLTDNRGFEADQLTITLDDADGQLQLPPRGARLTVLIGWKGEPLTEKGTCRFNLSMQHPFQLSLSVF